MSAGTQFTDLSVPEYNEYYYFDRDNKCKGWTYFSKLIMMSHDDKKSVMAMKRLKQIISVDQSQVNIRNKKGWTPLMIACANYNKYASSDCITLLIDNGADVNERCCEGETAFMKLLERPCKGETAFMKLLERPCEYEYPEKLVNLETNYNVRNRAGETILHIICKNTGTKLLHATDFIIKNGADVNASDFRGNTPLMYLIKNKYVKDKIQLMDLLLLNGADADIRDLNGENAVTLCCNKSESGDELVILNKHGANLNLFNDTGYAALHILFKRHCADNLADVLIKLGADVNLPNLIDNDTPLMMAIELDKKEHIVKLLIDNGANVNSTNKKGEPVLNLALFSRWKKYDVVEHLLNNGVDANLLYNDKTVLMHLCEKKKIHYLPVNILNKLIEMSDISISDTNGLTAYDYYVKHMQYTGKDDIKNMLMNVGNRIKSARTDNFC